MFSPGMQFFMFTVMVALGLALAFLFDAFRAVRVVAGGRGRTGGRWLVDAADLLFWLVAVPGIVFALALGSWGQLRAFTFLGLGAGVLVYTALGSPTLLPAMVAGLMAFTEGTVRTVRFAGRASRALARRGRWAGGAVGRPILRLAGFLMRPVIGLLAPLWRPLAAPWRRWQERARGWIRALQAWSGGRGAGPDGG
ncbi:MAG: spore cortex biosynthesis protein YabQ [Bacillota bacterium]|nr:MAG: spore cortex biosynthesis protein YabQ [Bacillota bacterium]